MQWPKLPEWLFSRGNNVPEQPAPFGPFTDAPITPPAVLELGKATRAEVGGAIRRDPPPPPVRREYPS